MVYIVHSRGNLFLHCHRIFTVQMQKSLVVITKPLTSLLSHKGFYFLLMP